MDKNKKILITGTKGFLGRHTARYFKSLSYSTYGIGHGDLLVEECQKMGLDYWYKSDVSINAIKEINEVFDVIIHCGGSGSVGFSVKHPYEDFKKTVEGTLEILEYIRLYNPNAHLIYPSSPAVQGECKNEKIKEDYIGKPASPYGYHKKIAENLCQSYSDKYDIKLSIVRLFSIYGNGLKKQLLWDACAKLMDNNANKVEFLGTGEETRDFIHINDVTKLFYNLIKQKDKFIIINGGTGIKHTIQEVVKLIGTFLAVKHKVSFNQQVNEGNPIYYWANIDKQKKMTGATSIAFEQGLYKYIKWVKGL